MSARDRWIDVSPATSSTGRQSTGRLPNRAQRRRTPLLDRAAAAGGRSPRFPSQPTGSRSVCRSCLFQARQASPAPAGRFRRPAPPVGSLAPAGAIGRGAFGDAVPGRGTRAWTARWRSSCSPPISATDDPARRIHHRRRTTARTRPSPQRGHHLRGRSHRGSGRPVDGVVKGRTLQQSLELAEALELTLTPAERASIRRTPAARRPFGAACSAGTTWRSAASNGSWQRRPGVREALKLDSPGAPPRACGVVLDADPHGVERWAARNRRHGPGQGCRAEGARHR